MLPSKSFQEPTPEDASQSNEVAEESTVPRARNCELKRHSTRLDLQP